jgi:hypothetical protein
MSLGGIRVDRETRITSSLDDCQYLVIVEAVLDRGRLGDKDAAGVSVSR